MNGIEALNGLRIAKISMVAWLYHFVYGCMYPAVSNCGVPAGEPVLRYLERDRPWQILGKPLWNPGVQHGCMALAVAHGTRIPSA